MQDPQLFNLLTSSVNLAIARQQNTSLSPSILWIADENSDTEALAGFLPALPVTQDQLTLVTNRFDIHQHLGAVLHAEFSDFDFSRLQDNSISLIAYRLSKERPVVHHILNEAQRLLQDRGEMLMIGKKQEGIKGFFDKAKKVLGFNGDIKKIGDDYLVSFVKNNPHINKAIEGEDYSTPKEFRYPELTYLSKPGLYGWDKIDKGSAFLIEQCEQHIELNEVKHILDLGCGFGYLSLMIAKLTTPERIVATDNNAAAITICQRNLDLYLNKTSFEVIADNCGNNLHEDFDLILCNPPFHQGFKNDFSLTEKFIASAKRLCRKNGQCLFVFNAFIPAEKIAARYFKTVKTLANNKQFKVLAFTNSK